MHFLNRRRRHYANGGARQASPWLILAVCAVSALILTVVIGLLLRHWVDEETLQGLRDGTAASPDAEETPPDGNRTPVRANAYTLGDSTDSIWENPEVSILINTPDGILLYSSPVASYLGYPTVGGTSLADGFDPLNAAASHVSGVFYPRAYLQDTADLRYAETAREAALLREFLEAGGTEIVLIGLPWDGETVDRSILLDYVRELRAILSDTPIGVSIPLSIANDGKNWKLLSRIEEVSDFCLLDLCAADGSRAPEEWLSEYTYFEEQYGMRLLLGAWQAELIEAASALPDVQTVVQAPQTEEEQTPLAP